MNEQFPHLAFQFFVVFSRFEYALKKSGTYAKGNATYVKPNWKKFANDLGPQFYNHVMDMNIANVLIDQPPKQQVLIKGGPTGWLEVEPASDSPSLIEAVLRVRNNLFHGGKYRSVRGEGYTEMQGSERNEALLRASLAVLEQAHKCSSEIRQNY